MTVPASVVTVIDPQHGSRTASLEADADGRLVLGRPAGSGEQPDLLLSPGWVDLHAHVYDGVTQISVHPDRVGLDHGVHVLADAGSAGEATVRGMVDYLLPRVRTSVKAWLNIGSHGLVHLREVADPSFIDVDATIRAVESHRDLVCGIKVRSSGLIVGSMGLQPLQLAKLAAGAVGLPVMVHIGEAPPPIGDVLDLLDEGDVVTHCFHGKVGGPWNADGSPSVALERALGRGVRLDVGHGAASFDIGVARRAIGAGVRPSTISTDIHVRNVDGPVFDLATVMTKLLDAGLSLEQVVAAVTDNARSVLGLDTDWAGAGGPVAHATLFRVLPDAPEGRAYRDSNGAQWTPERHIAVVGTIVDGRWCPSPNTATS